MQDHALKVNNIRRQADRRNACPGLFRMPLAADGRLCRLKLPLSRLTLDQFQQIADGAKRYGNDKIELTTRGNIQLRGIADDRQLDLTRLLIKAGLGPISDEGDDVRNVMVSATSSIDKHAVIDTAPAARELLNNLQSNRKYQKLSPKFSILINGGESTEKNDHISDIFVSPLKLPQLFVIGIASCPEELACSERPFCVISAREITLAVIKCVDLFCQWREYLANIERMRDLAKLGLEREFMVRLRRMINSSSPSLPYDVVKDNLSNHSVNQLIGIFNQRDPKRYYLGVKPPLGRLDSGKVYSLLKILDQHAINSEIRATARQGLIIPDCSLDVAKELAKKLAALSWVVSPEDPLAKILCCSGQPECKSALCDVQRDATALARLLTDSLPLPTIHVTGCQKGCASNYQMPLTLVAVGDDRYQLYRRNTATKNKFGDLIAEQCDLDTIGAMIIKLLGNWP